MHALWVDQRQAITEILMENSEDPRDERIYELQQENTHLRTQITYLQEEIAAVEDNLSATIDRYEDRLNELEQQLGDALYGDH